jgi:hypothetical protein
MQKFKQVVRNNKKDLAVLITIPLLGLLWFSFPGKTTIAWNPPEIKQDIQTGGVQIVNVSFVSKKDLQNVSFRITPRLNKYVRIESTTITEVKKDTEYTVSVIISIPPDFKIRNPPDYKIEKDDLDNLRKLTEEDFDKLFKEYGSFLKEISHNQVQGLIFVKSEKEFPFYKNWFKKQKPKLEVIHPLPLRVVLNVKEPSIEVIPEGFTFTSPELIREDPETGAIYVNNEIIIGFEIGTTEETIKNIVSGINGVFLGSDSDLNWYQIRVSTTGLPALKSLIQQLESLPEVKFATLHLFGETAATPTDPKFDSWDENNPDGNNWGQEFIKLPSAWDITTGSNAVKIGVVDDGFDINHEDLKPNIFYVGPGNLVRPHGTFVTGIVGAKGNNSPTPIGIAGVMWDSSLLVYSVAYLAESELEYSFPIAAVAFKNAALRGAKVINFSIKKENLSISDLKEYNKIIKESIEWINSRRPDVLFVFCAGNRAGNVKYTSPSSLSSEYDNVISVAANDESGNLAIFPSITEPGSNWGEVSVAAPGTQIYSTIPNNDYGFGWGTSMSAPFVSGLAGLIYSVDPSKYEGKYKGKVLTAADVKELIIQGAINGGKFVSGPDGHQIPIINAYESLKLLITPAIVILQPGPGEGKDIWTTSVYSYAPEGGGPGGGLDNEELVVGGWGDLYYSLLQFDLRGMPGQASSAKLELFPFTPRGGSPTGIYLDRIAEFWDWRTQGTGRDRLRLWWADRPATVQWIPGALPAPILNQWYTIDITDLYNFWQNGTCANYGVQLRPVFNNNRWDEFYSSDYLDDPSLRPRLVIVPASGGAGQTGGVCRSSTSPIIGGQVESIGPTSTATSTMQE